MANGQVKKWTSRIAKIALLGLGIYGLYSVIGIGIVLPLFVPLFLALIFSMIFSMPWWGFNQFNNIDIKDVEEKIFNNQLKRLQKVTGMTLPPYTVRFREPVTDLNGSFYGVIFAEFKELLKEDFLADLKKRIKEADPCSLWVDGKLHTSISLTLEKDRHYMYLNYGRMYYEKKCGGFCINDNRNVQSMNLKDFKELFGSFDFKGSIGGFSFKSEEMKIFKKDN